jgi:hypothetical protein
MTVVVMRVLRSSGFGYRELDQFYRDAAGAVHVGEETAHGVRRRVWPAGG